MVLDGEIEYLHATICISVTMDFLSVQSPERWDLVKFGVGRFSELREDIPKIHFPG